MVLGNEPWDLGGEQTVHNELGDAGLNIIQTVNNSRGDVAYNVTDLSEMPEDVEAFQQSLSEIEGVLSSRFITGKPDKYFVTGG